MTRYPPRYGDETQEEYEKFLGWFASDPKPAVLDPVRRDLAQKFEWSLRAAVVTEIPLGPSKESTSSDPRTLAKRLLTIEVGKYLKRSEMAPGVPVLSPHEMIRLAALLLRGEDEGAGELGDDDLDLSEMSTEDLQELERLTRKAIR
jgi:hypothetical protein